MGFNDLLTTDLLLGNNTTNSCGGSLVEDLGTPNSVALSGASVASNSSCVVAVQIIPTGYGVFQDSTGAVSSNEGGSGAAASATLTVAGPLPTVTGISPASGPWSGGTAVTISGTNFDTNSGTVNSGTASATNVTVVSATEIPATSPQGAATVDDTVTTSSGTSPTSTSDLFSYGRPSLVVNSTEDDPNAIPENCQDGGSTTACSLRDALAAASADGSGKITFSSSTFSTPQTISMQSTLSIPAYTSIQGPTSGSGASLTNLAAIDGGKFVKLLTVGSGVAQVSISSLNLTQGGYVDGGAISNAGTLTVTSTTISNSVSAYGGGIYNTGTLTVLDSTFSGNYAGHCGGGIYDDLSGTATVTNSTFEGNTGALEGGALCLFSGSAAIHSSTIAGNLAGLDGGGIFNRTSPLTVGDSIVSGNQLNTSALLATTTTSTT